MEKELGEDAICDECGSQDAEQQVQQPDNQEAEIHAAPIEVAKLIEKQNNGRLASHSSAAKQKGISIL